MSAQPPEPITSLDDPRAIQILSTEHWSLLSSRSLAYNEAFVRGGMFLTFLATSLVAIALLAQAMAIGAEFLTLAAIILAFDLVIGLTTCGRIVGANGDDLRAVHGMARIRHAYTQAAPIVTPYFTTATHDDLAAVTTAYGTGPDSRIGNFLYALTTSAGMIALITAMVGGVLAGVLGLIVGVSVGLWPWIGAGGAILVFLAIVAWATTRIPREQALLTALFPTPEPADEADPARQ
jgi:hypothetical protein